MLGDDFGRGEPDLAEADLKKYMEIGKGLWNNADKGYRLFPQL